ncbi:ephrin receptor 1-like isoform X2 [Halichondria panicea]|uniref:ephrin receptor 1-like isoform X2 n=1 Tax=Halichondria panicea TaxID=6063 RepID=UPI00312B7598
MVYLNLNDSAKCYGTLSSYKFCHYPMTTGTDYNAFLAVFRRQGDTYVPVMESGAFLQVTVAQAFNCSTSVPEGSGSVQIEPGDVIGVCLGPLQGQREQLNLVGNDATGFSVSGVSISGNCNLNTATVTISELINLPDRILHLSAEFSTNQPTSSGSLVPTPTTNPPTGGAAADNTAGVAVGVVFALLFVAVLVALIVIVVIVITKRGKTSYSLRANNNHQAIGIDNQIYGTGELESSFTDGKDVENNYEVPHENGDISPYEVVPPKRIGTMAAPASHKNLSVASRSATMPWNIQPAPYEGMAFGGDVYSSPIDAMRYSELIEQNKEEDIYSNVDPFQAPAADEDEIYSQLHSWGILNLSSSDVVIKRHLGSGQFGSVELGQWNRHGTKPVDVALKSLTKTSEEDKVKFLQEAAIMAQFRHPNVIMLYGVIAKEEPMTLVVELAQNGDLREFLLSMRPESFGEELDDRAQDDGTITDVTERRERSKTLPPESSTMFLKFSQQVALGMQYLAGKGFVHRDLAARNILVIKNKICKVADFGMSRDLENESYYVSHGGKIPVKWTAPEAIHYKKYSTASDVWAYECLLYEIWSIGHKPFEGIRNVDVIETVDSGKRLPPPPGIPKILYELMILCWHPETELRPAFRDIVLTLVGNKERVLDIPEEDSSTNPLSVVLGAPLEAGENMYSQLQSRYIDYAARKETEEDYFEID